MRPRASNGGGGGTGSDGKMVLELWDAQNLNSQAFLSRAGLGGGVGTAVRKMLVLELWNPKTSILRPFCHSWGICGGGGGGGGHRQGRKTLVLGALEAPNLNSQAFLSLVRAWEGGQKMLVLELWEPNPQFSGFFVTPVRGGGGHRQ